MVNFILAGILAVIAGVVIWYLYRAKKRGQTCIGCPCSGKCGGNCSGHGKTDR